MTLVRADPAAERREYFLPTKTIELKLASVGSKFEFVDECFLSWYVVQSPNIQQQSAKRLFVQSTTVTAHHLFEHQP